MASRIRNCGIIPVKKYNSPHGVLISSTEDIRMEDGILHLPLTFFSHA